MTIGSSHKPVLLISGANGFIGSHLIDHLLSLGTPMEIRAISRFPVKGASQWLSFRDFMNGNDQPEFFSGITHFVHAGGVAHRKITTEILELLKNSEDFLKKLLETVPFSSVDKIVLLSSYSVSLMKQGNPSDNLEYAQSKWKKEVMVTKAFDTAFSGTQVTILRPPLVYGPGAPGNFEKLLKLLKLPVVLPFGSLSSPRASIHVINLCSAIETILNGPKQPGVKTYELKDPWCETLNGFLAGVNTAIGGRAKLIPFPPKALEFVFRAMGKTSILKKLSLENTIDPSDFISDFAWTPPIAYEDRFSDLVNLPTPTK